MDLSDKGKPKRGRPLKKVVKQNNPTNISSPKSKPSGFASSSTVPSSMTSPTTDNRTSTPKSSDESSKIQGNLVPESHPLPPFLPHGSDITAVKSNKVAQKRGLSPHSSPDSLGLSGSQQNVGNAANEVMIDSHRPRKKLDKRSSFGRSNQGSHHQGTTSPANIGESKSNKESSSTSKNSENVQGLKSTDGGGGGTKSPDTAGKNDDGSHSKPPILKKRGPSGGRTSLGDSKGCDPSDALRTLLDFRDAIKQRRPFNNVAAGRHYKSGAQLSIHDANNQMKNLVLAEMTTVLHGVMKKFTKQSLVQQVGNKDTKFTYDGAVNIEDVVKGFLLQIRKRFANHHNYLAGKLDSKLFTIEEELVWSDEEREKEELRQSMTSKTYRLIRRPKKAPE